MKETTKETITYAREAKHELNVILNGDLEHTESELKEMLEMAWKLTFAACYTAETKKAFTAAQSAVISLMHAHKIVQDYLAKEEHIDKVYTFDTFTREEARS